MGELDSSLKDFFTMRVIDRTSNRSKAESDDAAAVYSTWWWTEKKRQFPCGQKVTWPDGQEIVCDSPLDHTSRTHVGAGSDGHAHAFNLQ